MSEIRIENIPETWDDTRDVAFFRITAGLFTTDFVYGAGVVLGSYDDLDAVAVAADPGVSSIPASTPSSLVPVAPRNAR